MNRQQACVHIATHAATRLQDGGLPRLPQQVQDALADVDLTYREADLGDRESGYDAPTPRDLATLVAAAAVHGAQAVWHDEGGVRQRPEESTPGHRPRDWVRGALDAKLQVPAGFDRERFRRVVETVADEVVATLISGGAAERG